MLTPEELAAVEDLWPYQRELGIQTHMMLSVTGVMRRAGLVRFHIPKAQLAQLAVAGKDVHLVCEDIARGKVSDYWSALPEVAGYARSFQQFVKDFDFQVELIERRLDHPFLGYTGRLDQAGFIFASSRSRRRPVVIDVKRGVPAPSHVYQTAAYAELVNRAGLLGETAQRGSVVLERWCIYLQPDGYQPKRHDNYGDFAQFTALLTTARIRQQAGLINERDEFAFDYLLRNAQHDYQIGQPGLHEEPRL